MNNNLTPAATVLVLRDSEEGMEVLMVKRSKKPPFENLYVFPGGKIDEGDCLKEIKIIYTQALIQLLDQVLTELLFITNQIIKRTEN